MTPSQHHFLTYQGSFCVKSIDGKWMSGLRSYQWRLHLIAMRTLSLKSTQCCLVEVSKGGRFCSKGHNMSSLLWGVHGLFTSTVHCCFPGMGQLVPSILVVCSIQWSVSVSWMIGWFGLTSGYLPAGVFSVGVLLSLVSLNVYDLVFGFLGDSPSFQ